MSEDINRQIFDFLWQIDYSFGSVNCPQAERDWNYRAMRAEVDDSKLTGVVLAMAGKLEVVLGNPEITEQTEKCMRLYHQAKLAYVEKSVFDAEFDKLKTALKTPLK